MTAPTLTHHFLIEEKHTAHVLGNEGVFVLGTPFLLLFKELSSQYLIEQIEGTGTISVGISADFQHLAAVPVGRTLAVSSTLTGQDRRKYSFDVVAMDGDTLVGTGNHERFRVDDLDEFLAKSRK